MSKCHFCSFFWRVYWCNFFFKLCALNKHLLKSVSCYLVMKICCIPYAAPSMVLIEICGYFLYKLLMALSKEHSYHMQAKKRKYGHDAFTLHSIFDTFVILSADDVHFMCIYIFFFFYSMSCVLRFSRTLDIF